MSDLISREDLKKRFEELHLHTDLIELIDNAPTVEYTFEDAFQKTICEQRLYCPERPQGEWIENKEHAYLSNGDCKEWTNFYCSVCDAPANTPYNFCPNCGADMRGVK